MSLSSYLDAPSDTAVAPVGDPVAPPHRRPRWQLPVLLLTAVGVAAVHFRPWQGGLLEEWGLALAWRQEGFAGYVTRLPLLAGRPLHLLPAYLGLALTNGGFVGQYLVLALIALAQFFLAMWALRPLLQTWLPRWGLATAIALHPWWVAGDLLRYMPGQFSVLAVVVWFGGVVRYIRSGRVRWAITGCAALEAGLLAYQAPAAAVLGGALALAITQRAGRRPAAAVVLTGATVGLALAWSAVVAPMISSQSYESQLLSGSGLGPLGILHDVLRTLVVRAPDVLVITCAVGAVVIALGLEQRLVSWQVWSLLALALGAPVAAFVYSTNALELNDPERVVLPTGVLLWIVVACVSPAVVHWRRAAAGLLGVAVVATVVGALVGYHHWTRFAAEQQELLAASGPYRAAVPSGATLVVADASGRYGDVYTLLPPYLDLAMQVEYGSGPETVLCTPTGVTRQQPVAALFPLPTTPDCSPYVDPGRGRPLGSAETSLGRVLFYAAPPLPAG